MLIKIYRYNQSPIFATFIGNAAPQGFTDYRIVSKWVSECFKGNTGWERQ